VSKQITRKAKPLYRQKPQSNPEKSRLKVSSRSREKGRVYREQIAIPYTPARGVSQEAQPFLKWVGGKSQLLAQFDKFFPTCINRYIEPFVGGGAVFFHLKHRFPSMKAFLRDNNDELINTYTAVRDYPVELMRRLDQHLEEYKIDRENYYYTTRSKHHLEKDKIVERASRMIFLNKTCFNGLWRVNSRGEFNVPIGSHKNPALYDEENILAASRALESVHLDTKDFRDTLEETRNGEFVYIDPPYFPVSATASFTSYTKDDFGSEEQHELAALVASASKRGVHIMLSNSDTSFIRKLYQDFSLHTVRARRMVNCDGTKRGEINEVVISTKD
jgi:DNA adenine methylase